MSSLIALINALTAPVSLSALKSVLLAIVGQQQEFYFERTLTSAEILALNTTPITLVAAQGANTIIVPTSITGQLVYGTTPYATEDEIDIYSGTAQQVFGFATGGAGFLFSSTSKIVNAASVASVNNQYAANSPLTIATAGGNPTAGDSTIIIRGFYKVIDIS